MKKFDSVRFLWYYIFAVKYMTKGGERLNTRIQQIRKTAKLTQDEFAEKIGLSKNFVWMIEKGERIPSDRTIKDICRIFGVNEEWLRTGEGDMPIPKSKDEEIAEMLADIQKSDEDSVIGISDRLV